MNENIENENEDVVNELNSLFKDGKFYLDYLYSISQQQKEIAFLLMGGFTNSEIAFYLRTTKVNISNQINKMSRKAKLFLNKQKTDSKR